MDLRVHPGCRRGRADTEVRPYKGSSLSGLPVLLEEDEGFFDGGVALGGVGGGVAVHVVFFVFDADVALEILALEFVEDLLDFADALAPGDVVMLHAGAIAVLEMAAHDAALEDVEGFNGIDAGREPVAGVGTRAHAGIAVLHEGQDVIRGPRICSWDPSGSWGGRGCRSGCRIP